MDGHGKILLIIFKGTENSKLSLFEKNLLGKKNMHQLNWQNVMKKAYQDYLLGYSHGKLSLFLNQEVW